jgi:hypothetical protein
MWDCEAYGPEGTRIGALCFFGGEGERHCVDPEDCHQALTIERQRVFGVIQEGAAKGNPDMEYFARAFTSPEQLLGGSESASDDPDIDAIDLDIDAIKAEVRDLLRPPPQTPEDPETTARRWEQFQQLRALVKENPIARAELAELVAEVEAVMGEPPAENQ